MAGQRRPGYEGLFKPFLKDILRWSSKGVSNAEIARRINERDPSARITTHHVYYVLQRYGKLPPPRALPAPLAPAPRPRVRRKDTWATVRFS